MSDLLSGMRCRRPKNPAEAVFYDACRKHGVDLVRRGWPDYACFQAGKFFVVEVKAKRSDRLKGEQMLLLRTLAAHGIKAYKWSPDAGFTPVYLRTPKVEPAGTLVGIKRAVKRDLRQEANRWKYPVK